MYLVIWKWEAPDVICESFQLENMFPLCGQLKCLLSGDVV